MTNHRILWTRGAGVLFLTAVACSYGSSAWSADVQDLPLVRVRSGNPSIVAVIREAAVRSTVFRRLMKTIDATDGLVYVEEGKCGHSVSACLLLTVQVAGPHRLVRILVDPRRDKQDCAFMASIGHELQHAIEVLSEPKVRDYSAAYLFYEREGPNGGGANRFETAAALQTGFDVSAEVCLRK